MNTKSLHGSFASIQKMLTACQNAVTKNDIDAMAKMFRGEVVPAFERLNQDVEKKRQELISVENELASITKQSNRLWNILRENPDVLKRLLSK